MEFELLHLPELPGGPFEALRRYLLNPRRQMQAWGDAAPASPGLLVLGLVAVELAVARRLSAGAGLGLDILSEAGLFIGGLVLAELAALFAGGAVASLLEKPARPWTGFCFLNLGLSPLLLWLPFALVSHALGWNPAVGALVMLVLWVRVAARWRDGLQAAYRLSRLQTVAAAYGALVAIGLAVLVTFYVTVMGRILSFLS